MTRNATSAPSAHSLDHLNRVIGQIYDAAVEYGRWPAALKDILRFVGNSGTHLWLINGETGAVSQSVHVGMPDGLIQDYNGEVIRKCPRWANARKHPERTILFDYQHIDERDIDSNEYYHWLQTTGDQIRYYLGGRLRIGDHVQGFQSLAFRKKEGHAQQRHIERFSLVLPHVERAMQIGRRLGTWNLACQSSLEILNRLSHGVVILDAAGRAIVANRCAEALLEPPWRLALRGGRLVAADSHIDSRLQRLVGECIATSRARGLFQGGGLTIPNVDGTASLKLFLCPFKLPAETFGSLTAAAVVFLFGAGVALEIDQRAVGATFALTAAESRLAASLAGGATLNEVSKKLRISRNTGHAQLKSIFAKVGVHRRADLVRLLLPFSLAPRSRVTRGPQPAGASTHTGPPHHPLG